MKTEKLSFWILLGPVLLLAAILLISFKAAFLLGRPAWMFGLSISVFLASGISYLGFQEIWFRDQRMRSQLIKKDKEITNLQSVLDETHLLYREKVGKLEEAISSYGKKQNTLLNEKETALEDLKKGYEELFEKSMRHKSQAAAFQTALQDSLDEMRILRQNAFLDQERGKNTPKDLLNQHDQLRRQFNEKSVLLDQTRRRLFATEGDLLAFKNERNLELSEQNLELEKLMDDLRDLLKENEQLSEEISALEKIIMVSNPSTTTKKPKKKLEEMLELQFDP